MNTCIPIGSEIMEEIQFCDTSSRFFESREFMVEKKDRDHNVFLYGSQRYYEPNLMEEIIRDADAPILGRRVIMETSGSYYGKSWRFSRNGPTTQKRMA